MANELTRSVIRPARPGPVANQWTVSLKSTPRRKTGLRHLSRLPNSLWRRAYIPGGNRAKGPHTTSSHLSGISEESHSSHQEENRAKNRRGLNELRVAANDASIGAPDQKLLRIEGDVGTVILFYGPGYRAVFSDGVLISTQKNPLNPNIPAKFPNFELTRARGQRGADVRPFQYLIREHKCWGANAPRPSRQEGAANAPCNLVASAECGQAHHTGALRPLCKRARRAGVPSRWGGRAVAPVMKNFVNLRSCGRATRGRPRHCHVSTFFFVFLRFLIFLLGDSFL
ncbi:hypothetical protein PIB30_037321 [Stylosanthes scabra]|uniref:Uncharacterized protein n=1 Tax=Stylosanthes scabra TaxID=79078 RepID=A0ABU6QD88_9FABA|nr:hypothetical protein [Stylosanthes scabra]